MTTLPIKLPSNRVTLFLPSFTTVDQVNYTYDERITEDGETRITEDGETRILDGFDIHSYPELVQIKIPERRIVVHLPE